MAELGVPILMYHDVSPDPDPAFRRYAVTVREFTRQMRWLAAAGYEPIDLDALLAARQGRGVLPVRPVVITFDDGLQSCVDHAAPVLRAHGFTAVFFLVTGLMGATSRWMRAEIDMELPLFGWETARELSATGFQCGAHTVTHPRLTALDPARCREELSIARVRLEQELGRPAAHLAYPFGDWNTAVREIAAEAGYETACSTRRGLSAPDDDPLALHRVTVYGHDGLARFKSRVRTGLARGERLGLVLAGVTDRFRSERSEP